MELHPAEHPAELLLDERLEALSSARGLAIAEIAGRDSIAAAIAAVDLHGFHTLLTTIACTGTEYGDWEAPLRAVDTLRERLPHVSIIDPVWISSPRLWEVLNQRFAPEIAERFGVSSPCLACHLYLHLTRVPLARALGEVPVIAGERDTHDGRIKLSQTRHSIDASIEVFESVGLELLEPIRDATSRDVEALLGEAWAEGGDQLGCVLSGNYVGIDGEVPYDDAAHLRFAREYLVPAGTAIAEAWTHEPEPDYEAIVQEVLSA